MIESLITELIAALNKNTAAILASQADTPLDTKAPIEPAKRGPRGKTSPTVPQETIVDPEPPTGQPAAEEESMTPTRVEVAPVVTDTPHVASKTPTPAGQPPAGEHVDVDAVISDINSIVKSRLLKADESEVDGLKTKWAGIRKAYGVDRIADLRNNPAALLDALAKAKAL